MKIVPKFAGPVRRRYMTAQCLKLAISDISVPLRYQYPRNRKGQDLYY